MSSVVARLLLLAAAALNASISDAQTAPTWARILVFDLRTSLAAAAAPTNPSSHTFYSFDRDEVGEVPVVVAAGQQSCTDYIDAMNGANPPTRDVRFLGHLADCTAADTPQRAKAIGSSCSTRRTRPAEAR